jgi:hypothetical protein
MSYHGASCARSCWVEMGIGRKMSMIKWLAATGNGISVFGSNHRNRAELDETQPLTALSSHVRNAAHAKDLVK